MVPNRVNYIYRFIFRNVCNILCKIIIKLWNAFILICTYNLILFYFKCVLEKYRNWLILNVAIEWSTNVRVHSLLLLIDAWTIIVYQGWIQCCTWLTVNTIVDRFTNVTTGTSKLWFHNTLEWVLSYSKVLCDVPLSFTFSFNLPQVLYL